MTRNGIEYDLTKSPYIYNYVKNNYDIYFYFSSQFNLKRYEENYIDFIYNEFLKFERKYKYSVNNPVNKLLYNNLFIFFMIVYYMKIEKRGFYINYVNELGEVCVIDKDEKIINEGVGK